MTCIDCTQSAQRLWHAVERVGCDALRRFLLPFDGVPVGKHLCRAIDRHFAKDMGVATDQLLDNSLCDVAQ